MDHPFQYVYVSCTEQVVVKCCQTGKYITTKVSNVSSEDEGRLSTTDLLPGANIFVEIKGNSYPAEVVGMAGKKYTHRGTCCAC